MKCFRCKSIRLVNFVDGFGERRIFCKTCSGSFPQENFIRFEGQKNLREFNLDTYYKLRFHG